MHVLEQIDLQEINNNFIHLITNYTIHKNLISNSFKFNTDIMLSFL